MESQKEIKIIYKHYIPEQLIEDFTGIINPTDYKIIKIKQDDRYSNAIGGEISDIVIYIKEHRTEIIVGGLIIPTTYLMLQSGIVHLWKKIKSLNTKIFQSTNKNIIRGKIISVRYEDVVGRVVKINFNGGIEDEGIENTVEKALEFTQKYSVEEVFSDPDYVIEEHDKITISINYNIEEQCWEFENFGENRRKMEEIKRWGEENFRT